MDFDGFDEGPGVPAAEGDGRRWLRYSKAVAEAVIAGTRAGKVLSEVCAAPGMPSVRVVVGWTKARPGFGAALRAAREAAGLGLRGGARSSYCPQVAEAICVRLCEGEAVVSVLRDPEMPGYSTFYRWMKEEADFRSAVTLAREIQGLRLAEIGWEEASGVTPETAFATRVKLEHLRWYAGKLSPRKYGALKGVEPEGLEAAGRGAPAPRLQVNVTEFVLSASGKVMAIPPRCEADEQLYLETYGRPYDGPGQGRWRRAE
jgi:hypothetical protein